MLNRMTDMQKYIGLRLLTALPVLLGISMLAFVLGVLSPGDPAEIALNQNGLDMPTAEQIAAMREELGLNRPLIVQYFDWLGGVLHGNLGVSYINGKDILQELTTRLPVTIKLAILSLLLAGIGGIGLGIACALRQDGWLDNLLQNISNILLSVPSFWLALVFILVFSERLRILPTSGSESWLHFIMPSLVLASSTMALVCRFVRVVMLNEFNKQYFVTAKVRGLSQYKLVMVYALPNAIVPVLAMLGNYFASVLGGSVIIENIFAIPGISSMAIEAIRFRDYPVLQAYVLLSGWILVVVTVVVDIFIAYINPKVRLGAKNA